MKHFLRHALMAICALTPWAAAQTPPPAGVTAITLRPGVRLPSQNPITLEQVAMLAGPLADRLAAIVVVEHPTDLGDADEMLTIDDRIVRTAIGDTQNLPISTITINGRPCRVRLLSPQTQPVAQPTPREARVDASPAQPAPPTVRDQLTEHIRRLFKAEPGEIRLKFDRPSRGLLETPIAGLVCEIRATGASRSLPLAVSLYNDQGIAREGSVRVEVELLRPVPVLARPIERGQRVTPDDITIEPRWINPMAGVLSPEGVAGLTARRRLSPGQVIEPRSVEMPVLIKRGEMVSVRSVVGSAVVRTRARAMGSGRLDDLIELEVLGKKRKRLHARVVGPGRAMLGPAIEGTQS